MTSLFNSTSDRELYIRLCAEGQIEWEKGLRYFDKVTQTYKPTLQAIHHRTMEEALEVARNQVAFDEKQGKLRYSFDELLTEDYATLSEKRSMNLIKRLFEDGELLGK